MRNSRTSWTKELSLHFLVMLSHFSYRKKTQVVYSNKELQVLFKTLINFIRHITNKENISVDSLKFPPKSRGLIITEVILRVLQCKVSSLWNNHKSRSNYAIHTWCVRVLCLHLCLYNMCMYCLWRPENDTGPPERRGEGAGNQALVLQKSNQGSYPGNTSPTHWLHILKSCQGLTSIITWANEYKVIHNYKLVVYTVLTDVITSLPCFIYGYSLHILDNSTFMVICLHCKYMLVLGIFF